MRADAMTGDPRYKVEISAAPYYRYIETSGWKSWLLTMSKTSEIRFFYDVSLRMRAGEHNYWILQKHISTLTAWGAKREAKRIVKRWEKSAPNLVRPRDTKPNGTNSLSRIDRTFYID
jgi:hypothetical protein